MLHALATLPRRLRWALHKWSPSADRDFHNALFSAQRYDPFTFAYPGYLTIRRFAELTEVHLAGARHVVDFGCGPGEITCELARRNPPVRFTGVDHSEVAIARANEHKASLALSNVNFVAADISTFVPDDADVVMMFDSFHHLLDPAEFVRNLKSQVARFVLVEPAGDWLGGWQKTLEFDWISSAVDAIRARIAWQMNDPGAATDARSVTPEKFGEPIEHRYTIADLKHFFDGYGLQARGTIAGIGEYPPNPYAPLPLREDFGRLAANTITQVEDVLFKHNLDLHAKHWVIRAERGAPHELRTPRPVNPREGEAPVRAEGPFDVEILSYDGPLTVRAGTTIPATITLRNASWRPWRSDTPEAPVFVSYHWLDTDGAMAIEEGRRSPLPRPLAPGDTCTMTCTIAAPASPARYTLAIDLVEEGVTWFSRAGVPLKKIAVDVR